MKKKLLALILSAVFVFSLSAVVFADENLSASAKELPALSVDPVPIFDGDLAKLPSGSITAAAATLASPTVTDSYVIYDWYSLSPIPTVYASGYVTVKDGSNDYYHYTRVEIQHVTQGTTLYTSGNQWGYGKVSGYTGPHNYPGGDYTGKLYYGW